MNLWKRTYRVLLVALAVLAVTASRAWADMSSYSFGVSTGTAYDMSDATRLFGPSDDEGTSDPSDIGFTFYLNGTPYTQFSVSVDGLIGFGPLPVSACWENMLARNSGGCFDPYNFTLADLPQVAPFWDDLRVAWADDGDPFDGSITAKTFGDAPNRVLVVEYRNMLIDYLDPFGGRDGVHYGTFQARFYEGTNKIEYYYEHMEDATGQNSIVGGVAGASIGVAVSESDFASITPDPFGGASVSNSSVDDAVVLANNPIPDNTVYTLTPCQIRVFGNTATGGTDGMNEGDVLLSGMSSMHSEPITFQPFSIGLEGSPCTSRDYRFSIQGFGEGSGDYQISPVSGTVMADGMETPTITFTPTGLGERRATLIVTDDNGFRRSFELAASGETRTMWAGNLSEGGTDRVADGDVLLSDKRVRRLQTETYHPIEITDLNSTSTAPTVDITYKVVDPTGQYTIDRTSESISAGETSRVGVTFTPTGVGTQEAKLIVTADGETRTYVLRAYSVAPGGEFFIGTAKVGDGSAVFVGEVGCVGASANTQAVTVKNIGAGDFVLNGANFYATDTVYGQGMPPYPLLLTNGKVAPREDYVITNTPGVAPFEANQITQFPVVIPEGESRTLYITYIGAYPGKRFARAFVTTNGENYFGTGTDQYGNAIPNVPGLLTFDLFGRAIGGSLSDNATGGQPKTMVFPNTAIGSSSDITYTLVNPGTCDLRVSRKNLEIVAGDVSEFTLVNGFVGVPVDAATNDYILTPGATATVTVRFTPTQVGSRRASLWLKSNDSTVYIEGVRARGSYYLDLYGVGTPSVLNGTLSFGSAAIGIDVIDGQVTYTNPSTQPVVISTIKYDGGDQTEFAQDPTMPWPTAPVVVGPGQTLKLGARFAPVTGGSDGPRESTMLLITDKGDTIRFIVKGTAGTRALQLNPSTIAFSPISSGKEARQTITVTNAGSMPVILTGAPMLSGANAADFSLSSFPRTVLAPGQVEFLEVTYHPTAAGSSTAQVDFTSNAGPMQSIGLTATASSTKLELDSKILVEISSISGQAAERIVTLRNESNEAVSISDVRFSGADAAQFRVVRGADRVEANAEGELVVEVIPAGHDLVAELALTATNEVTGEQLVRVAEIRAEEQRTSGVSGEDAVAGGLELRAAVPNPTHGAVELSYRMVKGTEIRLSLYDMNGTLVKVLDGGYRGQGEHVVRVDLSDLASGQYQYRLTAGSVTLTKSVVVVK